MCSESTKSTIGVASIVGISIFVIAIGAIIFAVIISVDCKRACKSRWEKVGPYLWSRTPAERERLNIADGKKAPGGWKKYRGPGTHLMAADEGIEGKQGALRTIRQTTELRPILKNKSTPLIERIDPVLEDNNGS